MERDWVARRLHLESAEHSLRVSQVQILHVPPNAQVGQLVVPTSLSLVGCEFESHSGYQKPA
jgi:hypothetical protein